MNRMMAAGLVGGLTLQLACGAVALRTEGRVSKVAGYTALVFPLIAGIGSYIAHFTGAKTLSQALGYSARATLAAEVGGLITYSALIAIRK